jgi:hypothetical protein
MKKAGPVVVRPGDEVRDLITGFQGVVVCKTDCLLGCVRVGVQAPISGALKAMECTQTFDEAQLVVITGQKVPSPTTPIHVPDAANKGDRVQDVISGLKGVVTAISERLGGLRYAAIQPEQLKDGKPDEMFHVELSALKVLKRGVIQPSVLLGQQPEVVAPRKHGPRPDVGRFPGVMG